MIQTDYGYKRQQEQNKNVPNMSGLLLESLGFAALVIVMSIAAIFGLFVLFVGLFYLIAFVTGVPIPG